MRALIVVLCLSLAGCGGAIPLATGLALGLTAVSTSVTALHDCHADGGCKAIPLPP